MGVKNLWDVIESCKKILPLHHLQNKRVCIDLSCWMVQLQNVNKSYCATQEKVYLRGLFHRLRALIALNCRLIYVTGILLTLNLAKLVTWVLILVELGALILILNANVLSFVMLLVCTVFAVCCLADGSIPAIKLVTYRQRLNSGLEVTQDETNSRKGCSLRRNMGSEFSRMIKEAKAVGFALGIPCLDGIEEAEAQCALLNSESLCDGCFTSDSDVFLFGARTVYRDICLGEGGHVVCYEMADIETKLGLGRNSLIAMALLLGSDYSQGVHGLGPESACQIVKSVGDDNILKRISSEGLSFAKKAKGSKKQTHPNSLHCQFNVNGSDNNLDRRNQFLQVIDAYLKPKCHSADSNAVYRVLAQLPFQRATLQQICDQFFGWPPEKTDEYILPKIAERDLRRFANLRSTSSELGVKPPLCQMPVKCPVSGIVKHRKVQGRECFEVLWEGFDGLESSIVPADLIGSACPEMIAEFEERRVLGKKQNHRNPRTKKSKNRSTVAEVDLRLQNLLLDIESGNNTSSNDNFPTKATILEDTTTTTAGHFTNQDPLFVESQQSDTDSNSALPSCHTDPSHSKYEIIHLLSASPPVRSRKVSRCQQVSKQCIDVIELSESEPEMSPEHMKKARELRLFLASIRDDIS